MLWRLLVIAAAMLAVAGGDTYRPPMPGGTAAAVPGGAAVIISPGSPPLCTKLAGSVGLRRLSQTISELAVNGSSPELANNLRDLANELRAIAVTVSGKTNKALVDAAGAVDTVAAKGLTDPDVISVLSESLTELGAEVQPQCHFPVG